MNIQNALKKVAAFAITTGAGASFAHEGHAMAGTHWHATDAWGFAALGGMIVVAIWLSNSGK
ncbi:hypothetical protein [Polaromonas sp.]|uniref:hypothetical protein n=1 Tax=Polaromonas sp. TaxID=1869339 RepID=UPI002FC5E26C